MLDVRILTLHQPSKDPVSEAEEEEQEEFVENESEEEPAAVCGIRALHEPFLC